MRQKKKKGNATRALLGLEGFSNYGIQTASGELAVFLVQPINISVLSHTNVEIKIRHLLMVLSAHPGLEISCLDSCERFDDNKSFIKRRLQEENNPAVRGVLEQEIAAVNAAFGTNLDPDDFSAIMNYANHQLVEIAKSQLGNVGGEPYWSW